MRSDSCNEWDVKWMLENLTRSRPMKQCEADDPCESHQCTLVDGHNGPHQSWTTDNSCVTAWTTDDTEVVGVLDSDRQYVHPDKI